MLALRYATRFRRRISGAALIAFPLVGLASAIVGPESAAATSEQLETVAADHDEFLASVLLGLLALVLLIPAILGVAHPLRIRAVSFGNVGAGLALAGVIGLASLNGLGLVLYEMTAEDLDRDQMVLLFDRVESNVGFQVILVMALAGLGLGMLLLMAAAARGGLAPPWVPILVGAAIALPFFGDSKPIKIAFFVLFALALGRVGIRVLTLTDDAWESGRVTTVRPRFSHPRTDGPRSAP
jgi:hypothetical protein